MIIVGRNVIEVVGNNLVKAIGYDFRIINSVSDNHIAFESKQLQMTVGFTIVKNSEVEIIAIYNQRPHCNSYQTRISLQQFATVEDFNSYICSTILKLVEDRANKLNFHKSIEILKAIAVHEKFKVTLNNKEYRCLKEDDTTIFVFSPRSSTYGKRYNIYEFMADFDVNSIKRVNAETTETWHKRLKRAIKLMKENDIWHDLCAVFEALLNMSYEDYLKCKQNPESMVNKYSWAFETGYGGRLVFKYGSDETYLCKLKSMYFGGSNAYYKGKIEQALKLKQSYRTGRISANYDVSFNYDASEKKAWYSEEYRNCGNGHYYLAISSGTAIFCEND